MNYNFHKSVHIYGVEYMLDAHTLVLYISNDKKVDMIYIEQSSNDFETSCCKYCGPCYP